jgi:hypothetical protein
MSYFSVSGKPKVLCHVYVFFNRYVLLNFRDIRQNLHTVKKPATCRITIFYLDGNVCLFECYIYETDPSSGHVNACTIILHTHSQIKYTILMCEAPAANVSTAKQQRTVLDSEAAARQQGRQRPFTIFYSEPADDSDVFPLCPRPPILTLQPPVHSVTHFAISSSKIRLPIPKPLKSSET